MIDQILQYNQRFVEERSYEKFITDKYPDKKLAVLSCMDTRLTELLPAALGLKNGDAKIIKNAGGLVISPFDSAMRSLLVAVYELGVNEIMVIAHTTCGACHMSFREFEGHMRERGITDETFDTIKRCGGSTMLRRVSKKRSIRYATILSCLAMSSPVASSSIL